MSERDKEKFRRDRADRFGYPEGASVVLFDDEGNEIAEAEWHAKMDRKIAEAEAREASKAAS